MSANAFTVTSGLMIAFALFVVYTRLQNWFDSNVPIFFYVALIFYGRSAGETDSKLPMWLILASFALGLTLRFEFMNPLFTKLVKFLELALLVVMMYLMVTAMMG